MKALVYKEKALTFRSDYPTPVPGAGEALIRVIQAGICSTDIEITKGYMGFEGVPGHEFVGIVEECRNDNLVGKRVVGGINIGCGQCSYCDSGNRNHCPTRSVLGIFNKDGAFAEYLTLPQKNLHTLPDSVSDDEAVFVEPLAAAFEILEQVKISGKEKVCLLGDGKLAFLIAQVLSSKGCDLTVAGKYAEKLQIFNELKIKTTFYTSLSGRVFDIVVDATGSPFGLQFATRIVKPSGRIVLKTTVSGERAIDLNQIVIDEVSIIGSRCGPFEPAIQALADKTVKTTPLISKIFSIEDGVEAMAYAKKKGVLKVILKI